MSGKGSAPRPFSVDKDRFNAEFDRIFGKKDSEQKKDTNSGNPKKRTRPCPDIGSKA